MNTIKLGDEHIRDTVYIIKNAFNEFKYSNTDINGTLTQFVESITTKKLFKQGVTTFWGVYKKSELIGVVSTKRINHITFLFVKEGFCIEEIAKKLLNKVIEHCKKNNIENITVNALPNQVSIYKSLGFYKVTIDDKETKLKTTPMLYKICNKSWVHRYSML